MKKLVLVFAMVLTSIGLSSCTELEDLEDSEPIVLATGEHSDDPVEPGGGN